MMHVLGHMGSKLLVLFNYATRQQPTCSQHMSHMQAMTIGAAKPSVQEPPAEAPVPYGYA